MIVQRFVDGGTELLAGVVQDPVFGPLVAFGPGGVFAELIGDAAFRIAPLTDVDAEELVTGGKAGTARRRLPRRPPADVAALDRPRPPARPARRGRPRGRASSTSTRCSRGPTAASRSTRASACAAARASARSRAGSDPRKLIYPEDLFRQVLGQLGDHAGLRDGCDRDRLGV